MLKSKVALLAIIFLSCGLAIGAGDPFYNEIKHGDLETFNQPGDEKGWWLYNLVYTKRISTDSSAYGTYCVEMTAAVGKEWKSGMTGGWYRAEPNMLYQLTADYKLDFNDPLGMTFIGLEFWDQPSGTWYIPEGGYMHVWPASQWTTVQTGWLLCPPDRTWLRVHVCAGCLGNINGKMRVDNIILRKCPYKGDLNFDCVIDVNDLYALSSRWLWDPNDPTGP